MKLYTYKDYSKNADTHSNGDMPNLSTVLFKTICGIVLGGIAGFALAFILFILYIIIYVATS